MHDYKAPLREYAARQRYAPAIIIYGTLLAVVWVLTVAVIVWNPRRFYGECCAAVRRLKVEKLSWRKRFKFFFV